MIPFEKSVNHRLVLTQPFCEGDYRYVISSSYFLFGEAFVMVHLLTGASYVITGFEIGDKLPGEFLR